MRSFVLVFVLLAACKDDSSVTDSTVDSEVTGADSAAPVDADQDGVPADQDCDDNNPDVFPGADEHCDGLDNNCDGAVDEGVQDNFYRDGDGDGWGLDADVLPACTLPDGYAAQGGDCDDADPAYHPGADELDCQDPNDYNCDGSVGYADNDGDGFAACEECDDGDGAINPGATEVCDGADNNCDGGIDEDLLSTYYGDSDGDGYGDPATVEQACTQPSGFVTDSSDCDDTDAAVNPAASEVCNGVDDECDGLVDADDDSLDWSSATTWYTDVDGDSYGEVEGLSCTAPAGSASVGGDCDDSDAAINPDAAEICDGQDNDCDGSSDDADSSVDLSSASTWYSDVDGDGYGDSGSSSVSCSQPSGSVADDSDCDDTDGAVNPSASEVCDELDNDCDGLADDADSSLDSSTASSWYADKDADGYGDKSSKVLACDKPSGYRANLKDCDDSDASISPLGSETCDGVDEDCNGTIDDDGSVLGDGALCPGLSCDDVLDARGSLSDGIYWIAPTGTAYEAWCDMSTDGGGWTLLLTADGSSSYWGNNSSNWSSGSYDTTVPDPLGTSDFHAQAYSTLDTDELRICYQDTSHCYTFTHNYTITLLEFFTSGATWAEYSSGSTGISNTGSSAAVTQYTSALGLTAHSVTCTWLGVNNSTATSAIGLMGDWNCGCSSYYSANKSSCDGGGYPYHDDLAMGVGLQSCYDTNSCSKGGSGNLAGQTRGVNGVDNSGVYGEWHVFGR